MTLLTQQQVEEQMYVGGIKRMRVRMENEEAKGQAQRNPYAATVMRDFVLPLAEALHAELGDKRPGRRAAHAQLLDPLDLDAVAYLTVRTVLTCLLSDDIPHHRKLATNVGRVVHSELVLAQIEPLSPDLYHTLRSDFGRRMTKSIRHRMTVFKLQAKENGIELDEWGPGSRDQVGLYLLDHLDRLGMIDVDAPPMVDGKKTPGMRYHMQVRLAPDVLETINKIKDFVAINSPSYGPCVEPPRDWLTFNDGGFHTEDMRRNHPYLVKASSAARERLRDHDMPLVRGAVNALQRTAWRINARILDVVLEMSKDSTTGEIVSLNYDQDKPLAPAWLATVGKGEMTPEQ